MSPSHRHKAGICSENEHQTIYTDKARKQGETFASFITTDESRNPYSFGQMENKAVQTHLDTLKMTLDDIDTRITCLKHQHMQSSGAFKILKKISLKCLTEQLQSMYSRQ